MRKSPTTKSTMHTPYARMRASLPSRCWEARRSTLGFFSGSGSPSPANTSLYERSFEGEEAGIISISPRSS